MKYKNARAFESPRIIFMNVFFIFIVLSNDRWLHREESVRLI